MSTPEKLPDFDECVRRGCQGRDQEALRQAAERYSGDLEAELAAIAAGTHPIQERQRRSRR